MSAVLPKQSTAESGEAQEKSVSSIQIIGMSAVLPNLPILASWLKAALYRTDFRPVPLKEMVKVGSTLYSTDFDHIKSYEGSKGDEEDILTICHERLTGRSLSVSEGAEARPQQFLLLLSSSGPIKLTHTKLLRGARSTPETFDCWGAT